MRYKSSRALIVSVVLSFGILPLQPVSAQQTAVVTGRQPLASTAVDRAQVENYVRVMQGELEGAEARARSVTAQLVSLDEEIESRVDRIVLLLSSVRDSTDSSSVRMRKAKEDALTGLKATAAYYAQERDRRKKEMGNPYAQIDDDTLAADVAALNARIEKRVTQSLEIAASLVQAEEGRVEQYRDNDYSSESMEFRRLQKDASASVKIKADFAGVLRASMAKLTNDVKAREAELKTTIDPQRQAQLAEDIKTMRQTIDIRRSQIEELVTAAKPSTRPVSGKGAFEMDKMLDEMTAELKRDFAKFRTVVNERDAAQARLKPLKTRLEKATAMLEEVNNPPAATGN